MENLENTLEQATTIDEEITKLRSDAKTDKKTSGVEGVISAVTVFAAVALSTKHNLDGSDQAIVAINGTLATVFALSSIKSYINGSNKEAQAMILEMMSGQHSSQT
jgi:hypothetical protein